MGSARVIVLCGKMDLTLSMSKSITGKPQAIISLFMRLRLVAENTMPTVDLR